MAFIQTLGMPIESDGDSTDDFDSCDSEADDDVPPSDYLPPDTALIDAQQVSDHDANGGDMPFQQLKDVADYCPSVLKESEFNWFDVVDKLETQANKHIHAKHLDDFFHVAIDHSDISEKDKIKLKSSYLDEGRRELVDREANALNGEIVSDDESENPDDYIDIDEANEKASLLILKKKEQLKRRNRYLKCKAMAERNFLSRRIPKKISGTAAVS